MCFRSSPWSKRFVEIAQKRNVHFKYASFVWIFFSFFGKVCKIAKCANRTASMARLFCLDLAADNFLSELVTITKVMKRADHFSNRYRIILLYALFSWCSAYLSLRASA